MIKIMRRARHIRGLKEMIKHVPKGDMVEIGCYTGESTAIFAHYFNTVYAVDPWDPGYDESGGAATDMGQVEKVFDQRMKGRRNVSKFKMTSKEASNLIGNVAFAYIDGAHTYEAVKQDIQLWKDKCKVLGLHDYGTLRNPQVTRAIHELLGTPDKTFEDTSCLFL